jgi:hypothetical protein
MDSFVQLLKTACQSVIKVADLSVVEYIKKLFN